MNSTTRRLLGLTFLMMVPSALISTLLGSPLDLAATISLVRASLNWLEVLLLMLAGCGFTFTRGSGRWAWLPAYLCLGFALAETLGNLLLLLQQLPDHSWLNLAVASCNTLTALTFVFWGARIIAAPSRPRFLASTLGLSLGLLSYTAVQVGNPSNIIWTSLAGGFGGFSFWRAWNVLVALFSFVLLLSGAANWRKVSAMACLLLSLAFATLVPVSWPESTDAQVFLAFFPAHELAAVFLTLAMAWEFWREEPDEAAELAPVRGRPRPPWVLWGLLLGCWFYANAPRGENSFFALFQTSRLVEARFQLEGVRQELAQCETARRAIEQAIYRKETLEEEVEQLTQELQRLEKLQ